MRRYGNPPLSHVQYTLRPGAYVILPKGGQLLLTYQSQPEPEVQLPGGGIDPGEGPIQALHREVWEETGWSIAAPRRIGVYRRFVWMPDYDMYAEKLCHVYLARPVMQLSEPAEPYHSALWMAPEVAVELLGSEGDADLLRQFL
ncbi:8-oxo-dGTP diphosphatase [Pseudooceanicola antarcticus]|uniref:8-oxo-dGTP diphosphatase n=1 Tax=Pseudooceanicola antarcticus TaxID=1247613 RepID=A0A285HSJ9_9RHOB|nr:NUDIX hydrolase [Pseudooceanicola antarcticus]PJE27585.1 NUDIX domain-containing protein [Pseudooceanicola antarcticus]SNY38674.1 8-oxo-dGTP diphosphatase [Pseudooceanicola antarcticus]